MGARLLLQSYQYPNLSEGADRVGGQLPGDKECPFSDVTKSGRVWRKVPESGARSVGQRMTLGVDFFRFLAFCVWGSFGTRAESRRRRETVDLVTAA